jgi:hypothetical protein
MKKKGKGGYSARRNKRGRKDEKKDSCLVLMLFEFSFFTNSFPHMKTTSIDKIHVGLLIVEFGGREKNDLDIDSISLHIHD